MINATRLSCPVCGNPHKEENSELTCGSCGFDFAFVKYVAGEKSQNLLEAKINKAIDLRTDYPPCRIDKKNCYIDEEQSKSYITLNIFLAEKIPDNVVGFYYAIRTDKDSEHWASKDEIGKNKSIIKIEKTEYLEKEKFSLKNYELEEIVRYVSLFTIYNVGGNEEISEPEIVTIERTLKATIWWSLSYSIFSRLCFWSKPVLTLSLEIKGNIKFDAVPELKLCKCKGDSYNENNLQDFKSIKNDKLDCLEKNYKRTYNIETNESIKGLKEYKFYLQLSNDYTGNKKFSFAPNQISKNKFRRYL